MRYLLIDRYLELEKGRHGKAVKTVTHGEDFLEYGLSPLPVMPASLVVECQAQVAGTLATATDDFNGKGLLAKVDRAEFYRPITVGDRLIVTATMRNRMGTTSAVDTVVEVDGIPVARMNVFLAILGFDSEEGRNFDTPKFFANRDDLLREIGVYDLLGGRPAHMDRGRHVAAPPTHERPQMRAE
jgi:3-hydroxymyristoyl/3-hydroxydecanoyl-(acyl carrier protein) dehydratase